ncbi:MAG: DUF58 domain-containing protein [Dehalococcoidales bacterium]|nr:DUF58 domain-containing protein [Dehalococcoidales bacterium]
MKILSNRLTVISLRIYTIGALIVAALVSPPVLSISVLITMFAYLFMLWRGIRTNAHTMLLLFIFFGVAVLFSQVVNSLVSPLIAFPVLLLFNRILEEDAPLGTPVHLKHKLAITPKGLILVITAVASLMIGILVSNSSLLMSSLVFIIYLAVIGTLTILKTPAQPVLVEQSTLSVLVGKQNSFNLSLIPLNPDIQKIALFPSSTWLSLTQPEPVIPGKTLTTKVIITPPLSGPTKIRLEGTLVDRWGLTLKGFHLEPYLLNVIPRARYAEWLARKYLAETTEGTLPLVSTVSKMKPLYGLRRGIEYYGSQLYQPGDSLKNIDWKHSTKYNKLISKEFTAFKGQQVILLVNLDAGNEDEADKQAFNLVTAALSLAREQVPAAIAAYNSKAPVMITGVLTAQKLLSKALETMEKIAIVNTPIKYLGKLDIVRLRANINRLQFVHNAHTDKLAAVLRIEYENLKNISKTNPASQTLLAAMNIVGRQSSVIVVTQLNHDTEAIEFNRFIALSTGKTMIVI